MLTLIKCVISGSLIYWILKDSNVGEIFEAVRSANVPLLLLAFSLNFVGLYISVHRWRLLLRAQDVNASFPFLLKSYLVGMFFNNLLPSTIGGDALRAYDSWRVGKTKAGAVAVIFVDRFLGLLALMLFAVGALLVSKQLAANFGFIRLWILLGAVGTLLLGWIIFMASQQISSFIPKIMFVLSHRLRSLLGTLMSAFLVFHGRKDTLARALGLSMLLQANVVIHYYLFAKALDFSVPIHNFFLIIPLTIFIMMIPVSINAIGVRENALVFFFGTFGVSRPEAIALAWLAYGVVIFQGLLGGIVYALRK